MNTLQQPAEWPDFAPVYKSPDGWEFEKDMAEAKLIDTIAHTMSIEHLDDLYMKYWEKAVKAKGNSELVLYYAGVATKIIELKTNKINETAA